MTVYNVSCNMGQDLITTEIISQLKHIHMKAYIKFIDFLKVQTTFKETILPDKIIIWIRRGARETLPQIYLAHTPPEKKERRERSEQY